MIQIRVFVVLMASIMLLTACPVATLSPLQFHQDASPFNKNLVGKFKSNNTEEAVILEMEIKPTSNPDFEGKVYLLNVLKKGEMFSAESEEFYVWLLKFEGKDYVVLQEIKEHVPQSNFYLQNITFTKNGFNVQDIALNDIANIKDEISYQEEVRAAMKNENFLSSAVVEYTKLAK